MDTKTLRHKVRALWETKGYIFVIALCVLALGGTALVSRLAMSGNTQPPIETPYLSEMDVQEELAQSPPSYAPAPTPTPEGVTEAGASIEARQAMALIAPSEGTYGLRFSADSLIYLSTMDAWGAHTGLDIQADVGQAVRAAAAGTVTDITDDPVNGLCVAVSHSGGITSRYMGLSVTEGVVKGGDVTAGQIIGRVGIMPGERDEGPHLHFELEGADGYIDPEPLLSPLNK